jgi:hypothetical protein
MTVSTRTWRAAALAVLTLISLSDTRFARLEAQQPAIDPALLNAYRWRSIGPDRGGRSIAVSGVKGRPREAYFGAVGGGLWKPPMPATTGRRSPMARSRAPRWARSRCRKRIPTSSGSGRANPVSAATSCRATASTSRSTPARRGRTSASRTSTRSRRFASTPPIPTSSTSPRSVCITAERRARRVQDHRRRQDLEETLFKDNKTGAVDIAIDMKNPNVLFAAMWEAYRIEYQMSSGGPAAALQVDRRRRDVERDHAQPGMPAGMVGRIGVALTARIQSRLRARRKRKRRPVRVGRCGRIVEVDQRVRADPQRAFYYTHVFGDPATRTSSTCSTPSAFRSTDAGKTLTADRPEHARRSSRSLGRSDRRQHIVLGNDGGGAVTYDANARVPNWSAEDFPTAQWYHVITTAHLPFHVCGAQQDNSTLCVPSNTECGRPAAVVAAASVCAVSGWRRRARLHRAACTDPDLFWAGAEQRIVPHAS